MVVVGRRNVQILACPYITQKRHFAIIRRSTMVEQKETEPVIVPELVAMGVDPVLKWPKWAVPMMARYTVKHGGKLVAIHVVFQFHVLRDELHHGLD